MAAFTPAVYRRRRTGGSKFCGCNHNPKNARSRPANRVYQLPTLLLVVLGGGVSRSADMLIAPILKRLNGAIPNPPRLVVSDLGLQATVMGAITNVLHNTSNFYVVHKLS